MATLKFKELSPYTQPKPEPPPEDYIYEKYLKDICLNTDLHQYPVQKVAIFGLGRAGTIHLSNIVKNTRAKILYIVDDIEAKWIDIKLYWILDGVTFLTSEQSDKVFSDPNVDIVIVTSPTGTHEEIVTRSLEAKKAVFCEKPIAHDNKITAKCYEAAKKAGKPLFCAFNRRFDPSFRTLKNRVRKGDIGHVYTIKTTSRDSPLPSIEYLSTSGGIFHDCMVHDIDLLTWIIGEYPDKVSVQAHTHIPEIKAINDFDNVAATLHFPSGTLGLIDLSRISNYGYDIRLEAFGPKGMIDANHEQPTHGVTFQYGFEGPKTAPMWYSFASRFKAAYNIEFEHFLDVVVGKAAISGNAKETLAVSKIASACEESARTGKMIQLKWAEGELPTAIEMQ